MGGDEDGGWGEGRGIWRLKIMMMRNSGVVVDELKDGEFREFNPREQKSSPLPAGDD